MQRFAPILALAILLAPAPSRAQAPSPSPYVSNHSDVVKTLTPDEAKGLLEGEGMGLARPAEMNGFPGPRHVLDLADSLALTADQRARIEAIRAAMSEEAVARGRRIVDGERALDAAFAGGVPTEASIREILASIEADRGALRLAHLRAHLATAEILDRHQVHAYARLRGYGGHEAGTGDDAHVH